MRAAVSIGGYKGAGDETKGANHMKPFRHSIIGVLILIIAGCTTQFRNQGYIPNEDEIGALVVGVDTRDSVFEALGTPSTYGVLQEQQAYYVRSRFERLGLRAPKEVERQVLALGFDQDGVLTALGQYSLTDGQVVVLNTDVTENGIESLGVFKRIVASIGRPTAGQLIR
jgi:outer membrane protein assembly factor BamE (lipoprotein component of BamABCDE complex)